LLKFASDNHSLKESQCALLGPNNVSIAQEKHLSRRKAAKNATKSAQLRRLQFANWQR
jgi:hypothetical protein